MLDLDNSEHDQNPARGEIEVDYHNGSGTLTRTLTARYDGIPNRGWIETTDLRVGTSPAAPTLLRRLQTIKDGRLELLRLSPDKDGNATLTQQVSDMRNPEQSSLTWWTAP